MVYALCVFINLCICMRACGGCFDVYVRVQCRLEANYAHQQELDMIPLMMQKSYKPQGWRTPQHSVLCLCLLQHRHAVDMGCLCS